jgi:hypothetical protein
MDPKESMKLEIARQMAQALTARNDQIVASEAKQRQRAKAKKRAKAAKQARKVNR